MPISNNGPGITGIDDIADIGLQFYNTIIKLVDWSFTPILELIQDVPVIQEFTSFLPAWILNASVIECLFGSLLFFVLAGVIIRWIRDAFFF